MEKPLKRTKALQAFSREHHHALLLCWKIKTGFSKGVSAGRMKDYADWFYKNHLKPHFDLEEKYLYPVLGAENKLAQEGIADHRLLTKLFHDEEHIEESLKQIEKELEKHVRFEERTLFNEIQQSATPAQLDTIAALHADEKFADNLVDQFWE